MQGSFQENQAHVFSQKLSLAVRVKASEEGWKGAHETLSILHVSLSHKLMHEIEATQFWSKLLNFNIVLIGKWENGAGLSPCVLQGIVNNDIHNGGHAATET